jgi:hypothetical protein
LQLAAEDIAKLADAKLAPLKLDDAGLPEVARIVGPR